MRALFRSLFRVHTDLVRSYHSILNFKWLALGVVVGAMTGLGAVAFYVAVEALGYFLLHHLAGFSLPVPAGEELFTGTPGPSRPWLLFAFLGAVALLTGWLVHRFVPQTRNGGTDGTDSMIKAFHQQEGHILPVVPFIKVGTSVLTIAAGGSAGREGPISLLGAGCGSWLAGKLRLSAKERRIMLLAGAAGGLGAIFRAPLGGALTAVEVIYREDFEAEALLPSILSSVVSYSIFTLIFGAEPIFGIPKFEFSDIRELSARARDGFMSAPSGPSNTRSSGP
jgi:CIC family chloride channel protein